MAKAALRPSLLTKTPDKSKKRKKPDSDFEYVPDTDTVDTEDLSLKEVVEE